ncbi:MAG: hypothetical protein GY906_20135 [bacterium]|nr:hypothetical protein [bacterium]
MSRFESELSTATELIADLTGIVVPAYRLPVIETELERLGQHKGVPHGLDRFVNGDPEARRRLIRAVAIPETYLFRHAGHFSLLGRHAEKRASLGLPTRVLCAGCSTGEEAWSAAAVLASIPAPAGGVHRAVGWDLSHDRLKHAESGIFRRWACRKGLAGFERFFTRHDHGYTALPMLREIVEFTQVNLVTEDLPAGELFDVVFFRNVAIYWSEETTARFMAKLVPLATEDGLFFVGPSDPITLRPDLWEHRIDLGARSFHRNDPIPDDAQGPLASRSVHQVQSSTPVTSIFLDRPQPIAFSEPSVRHLPSEILISPDTAISTPVFEAGEDPIPELATIRSLADNGQYQEALKALDLVPNEYSIEAKLWCGILQLALDQADEAVRLFRQCVFLRPEDAQYRQWLAVAFETVGCPREAEREFRNAVELGQ